jgi:NADPH2 dehydrogenase
MDKDQLEYESNDFLRAIWGERPFISAGGHTRESGLEFADKHGDLIAYGRLFISNVSGYSVSLIVKLS